MHLKILRYFLMKWPQRAYKAAWSWGQWSHGFGLYRNLNASWLAASLESPAGFQRPLWDGLKGARAHGVKGTPAGLSFLGLRRSWSWQFRETEALALRRLTGPKWWSWGNSGFTVSQAEVFWIPFVDLDCLNFVFGSLRASWVYGSVLQQKHRLHLK